MKFHLNVECWMKEFTRHPKRETNSFVSNGEKSMTNQINGMLLSIYAYIYTSICIYIFFRVFLWLYVWISQISFTLRTLVYVYVRSKYDKCLWCWHSNSFRHSGTYKYFLCLFWRWKRFWCSIPIMMMTWKKWC